MIRLASLSSPLPEALPLLLETIGDASGPTKEQETNTMLAFRALANSFLSTSGKALMAEEASEVSCRRSLLHRSDKSHTSPYLRSSLRSRAGPLSGSAKTERWHWRRSLSSKLVASRFCRTVAHNSWFHSYSVLAVGKVLDAGAGESLFSLISEVSIPHTTLSYSSLTRPCNSSCSVIRTERSYIAVWSLWATWYVA